MMILNLLLLFVTKILYSPLFPSCPWLNLHQTVLFSDTDQGSDMLLMDYVPDLSVTNQVIWDLCIGKTVPGKIRIFHFGKGAEGLQQLTQKVASLPEKFGKSILVKGNYHENIMERVQQKINQGDYYDGSEPIILPILCKYGVDQVILSQDHKYHLYNNNCWHFSKKCITSTVSESRQ